MNVPFSILMFTLCGATIAPRVTEAIIDPTPATNRVHLLRKLGYAVREHRDTVYLWRTDQKRFRKQPPLVLRQIRIKHKKQTIVLVTNVLDSTRLSRQTAMTLYRMRWGVEVFYRSFKQTLQRRKMRSDSAPLAKCELHFTMIGLQLLLMLNVRQLLATTRRGQGTV